MGVVRDILGSFFSRKITKTAERGGGVYRNLGSFSFDGEKNLGEIGPIKDYHLDYSALRARSYQAYLENTVANTVINRYTLWMISKGLKIQSEPVKSVLESEGIKLNSDGFQKIVESRYAVWSKSKYSDFTKVSNLNNLAKEAFKNSRIGGDVLVVLRYNGSVNVQLIDGAHVCTPTDLQFSNKSVKNGIELSPTGEHLAYYVKQSNFSYKRIEAKSPSTGLTTAFLVYGNKYRVDNHRGMPMISVCLQLLKNQERYMEATVGSAEERAKIVFQIIHNANSTGENPMVRQLAKAFDANATDDLPTDVNGTELANTVAATTNKSTYNMPIGAEMKALESRNEIDFPGFMESLSNLICAAVGIPPNVAFSMYNDSFSASRAATKDWEHTINVNRDDFSFQFYAPIFAFWLHTEILSNKISAPGYLKAFSDGNYMALEAYRSARFIGSMFPHIDPMKEVNAERAKLGPLAENIPLTNVEAATEALNSGDSTSNLERFKEELKQAEDLVATRP